MYALVRQRFANRFIEVYSKDSPAARQIVIFKRLFCDHAFACNSFVFFSFGVRFTQIVWFSLRSFFQSCLKIWFGCWSERTRTSARWIERKKDVRPEVNQYSFCELVGCMHAYTIVTMFPLALYPCLGGFRWSHLQFFDSFLDVVRVCSLHTINLCFALHCRRNVS